jgi:diguanylate cyclase (GGDEF)-like protein
MSADALDLLLVSDDPALSEEVRGLLGENIGEAVDLHTVGEAPEALALFDRQSIDIILYAIGGGGKSALEGLAALDLAAPETAIIALADSADLALGEQALEAGAQDILNRDQLSAGVLRRAVRFAKGRKRKLNRMAERALRDQLTGLANRTLLFDRLANMVARARRNGTLLTVLFIDLDGFKAVNDTLGHAVGDALLKAVAHRLTGFLRRGDTVARLGGDEFVIALDNLRREEEATGIAAAIESLIAEPYRIEGRVAQVSASVGIAVLGPDTDDVESLVRNADSAMYRAKRGKERRL